MDIEKVKKGIEYLRKQEYIAKIKNELFHNIVLHVGSTRLDTHADIYERLKITVIEELNKIEQELFDRIYNL